MRRTNTKWKIKLKDVYIRRIVKDNTSSTPLPTELPPNGGANTANRYYYHDSIAHHCIILLDPSDLVGAEVNKTLTLGLSSSTDTMIPTTLDEKEVEDGEEEEEDCYSQYYQSMYSL